MDTTQVNIGLSNTPIIGTIIDSTATSCGAVCTGAAEVSASGGTGPYTYNWFTAGNQSTAIAAALCFGAQNVEVTDANGCVDTTQVNIGLSNDQMVISMIDSTATLCVGSCDGAAKTSVSGGNAPYIFDWFMAGNQTDTLAINLCPGINKVKVTDSNGCIDTAQVFINQPTRVSGASTSTNPNCNGECNGTATMVAAGGAGGYTHQWNTGSALSSIINLCAGTYADTITDANGCKDTSIVIITDPIVLQANPTSTRVACFGDNNGSVNSVPSGGTAPYSYQWNDAGNSTTNTISGLSAGVYQIIVSDSLGCSDTAAVTINTPTQLNVSIIDTVYTVCVCNGSATASVSGGTAPYSYLWNDLSSQTTAQATNLCVGNYRVIASDSSLCLDSINIAILDTSSSFVAITADSNAVSCFSNCDGSATVRGVNGTNPYTYLWNDPLAQTDSVALNLCAGNYIAQVTDSNGCVRITHATINTPAIVDGAISIVQLLCNGDCNSIAAVVPSGGDGGPYTHSWSTLSSNDSIFNVCAGTYYDTITDGSGCVAVITVTLGEPTQLTANTLKTDISCFGQTNGSINANASGGTTPYTYLWNDIAGSTSSTISGLSAGTYTVVVTDSNGCSYTDSATIVEPTLLTSSISDSNNVHCSCVGFANISANGGTLPYSFLWNDPSLQTDSTAVNLCAGFYTGTITDANGCITTSIVSIVDTSGFTASISDTNHLVCYGVCIGSATISASGGLTPYSYSWNDPGAQADSTAINLCEGNYIGTVTDALGCPFVLPITIYQPDSIHLNISRQNVSCSGLCDGEIISFTTGGTGSTYNYQWNDPYQQTTAMADSLCPGSYTVIVTDSVGCTNTTTRNITEPAQLIAFISSYSDVQCNGLCNGSINSLAVGGTAPYNYTWNNLVNAQNVNALCADTFYVTVTDANNCADSASQIIVEPLLALSSSIVDSTNLLCRTVCDGIATVRANGGTAGYNYNWYTAGNLNDTTGINLCVGLNYVEITDSKGCKDTAEVNLFAPPSIVITTENYKNVSCFNSCDGAIDVSVSGGVSPYTIQWNDPSNSTDTFLVNLCPGTYKAIVKDANGCTDSIEFIITEPNALSAVVSNQTNVFCQSYCDGNATIRVSGGTSPYAILWPNAGNQTDSTAINLCAQSYTYQITDTNNCVFTDSVTILNTGLAATIAQTNVTCFGLCNGAVTISHTGGLAPYTHSWATGSSDSTLSNICAGNYQDTLRDGSSCVLVIDIVISAPNQLNATIDSTNMTCNTLCDGIMTGQANGGTAPYSYRWITGNIAQQTINNLCAGLYQVEVTDSLGCIDSAAATIVKPAAISIALNSKTNTTCFAQCDGQAAVLATGGTGPFTYNWSGGQTGAAINNLCAGNDTLTATDSNSCSAQLVVSILEPSAIQISISSYSDVQCNGLCNGSINSLAVGGTAPYNYTWNNLVNAQNVNALCADTFYVTVTDANNCADSASQIIVEPLLALSSSIVDSTNLLCRTVCDGIATVRANGGTAGYNYNWYTAGNLNDTTGINLCVGLNYVEITDSKGCKDTAEVNLFAPPSIVITTENYKNVSCFNSCDGAIDVSVSGGVSPYTIQWNDPSNSTDTFLVNLCPGTYKAIVKDANGCTDSIEFIITEPNALSAVVSNQTNVFCQSYCDGNATIRVSGGTSPYAILWPNAGNQTDSTAINLCAQSYTYQITDTNNCVFTDSVTILNTGLAATIAQTNVTCFGLCNGAVTISHTGGLAPYTHSWATGSSDSTLSNICAGNYQDTLRDGSSCVLVIDIVISAPNQLNATIDSTNMTCNTLCDGIMTGQANGGTAPYSYRWITGNIAQQTINNLCAGLYQVEVTDSLGCIDSAAATIVKPAAISIALNSKTNTTCFAQCDGQAAVLATGGTGPFTYNWSGGQTGAAINNLCAGNDTLTATDSNSCSAQLVVSILEPSAIQISFSDTVQLLCSTVCDGEVRADVTGGNGSYTYLWNDPSAQSNNKAVGLCAGKYQVLVQDAKGCKDSLSYNINSLGAFSINITYTNPKCFGDCNGEVKATLSGGVKPYLSVVWGGPGNAAGKTTLTVKDLCQGNYFVTATDANNCQTSDAQQLTTPPLLTLTTNSTNPSCFGVCNGTAATTPNGGTAPYTYDWNDPNAQTTAQAINLCDGEWKVIVVDANGCAKADSTVLSEPNKLISNNTTTPAQCTNTFDGAIVETASGGTSPLSYSWSGPAGYSSAIEDPTNVLPGRYILTLTDGNNCTLIDTADIAASTFINAFAGNDTAICAGKALTLYGSGGTTYSWSTGETAANIVVNPSAATTYTLYVTSAACKDTATVVVNVNDQPVASVTMDAYLVLAGKSTTLHGTGAGIGGTYDWTPPTSLNDPTVQDPIATPTSTTTYLLTVTNASGCWDTASTTLKTAIDITFPNGITPNADGRNDTWAIDLIEQFPQCQVEIYNRWGQLLFQSTGYVQQWDGIFDGKPLPVGTYYYIIDLGPGLKKFTGPITLMR